MVNHHFSKQRSEVLERKRAGPWWKRLATDSGNVLPKMSFFLPFHKDEIHDTVSIKGDKELWIENTLSTDLLNWVANLFQIS